MKHSVKPHAIEASGWTLSDGALNIMPSCTTAYQLALQLFLLYHVLQWDLGKYGDFYSAAAD